MAFFFLLMNYKNYYWYAILDERYFSDLCFLFFSLFDTQYLHDLSLAQRLLNFFSCATQLSMKLSLLINMKMSTTVGIFIFISREKFMLSYI